MAINVSLSHAGLLAHASGVVPKTWNLIRSGSRPMALRSARSVARAPSAPKISSGPPHERMSSFWARGSTPLGSAVFSALSIATGEVMVVRALPWPPPALLSQRYLSPVSVWEECS